MIEDTALQEPAVHEPITEPGPPSLSAAYSLPDIAEWLYRALKDAQPPHNDGATTPLGVGEAPTDAQMALAVYEDWKERIGEGAGC